MHKDDNRGKINILFYNRLLCSKILTVKNLKLFVLSTAGYITAKREKQIKKPRVSKSKESLLALPNRSGFVKQRT